MRAMPSATKQEPVAAKPSKETERRPLVGNQLRWAKQVIAESLAQYRAKHA